MPNTIIKILISFLLFFTVYSTKCMKRKQNKEGKYKCRFCSKYLKWIYRHEKRSCSKNPNNVKQNRGGTCQYCDQYKKRISHHEKNCFNNPNCKKRKKSDFFNKKINKNKNKTKLSPVAKPIIKYVTQNEQKKKSHREKICPHCKILKKDIYAHRKYCTAEKPLNKKIRRKRTSCNKYKLKTNMNLNHYKVKKGTFLDDCLDDDYLFDQNQNLKFSHLSLPPLPHGEEIQIIEWNINANLTIIQQCYIMRCYNKNQQRIEEF